MEELHRITIVKDEKLGRQGYRVVVMWECEWRHQKETDPALALWCHDHDLVEPLDIQVVVRVVPGGVDRLDYLDFRTLYPYCNINRRHDEISALPEDDENEQSGAGPSEPLGSWDVDDSDPYPVGHPVIRRYTEAVEGELPLDISDIYGFIKCDVEAPSHGLYHPMLPYRCRNKLTFPLCRSCVESMAQELCTHAPEERYLRGTWVSEELVLALRKGYRIHRVWETYHYPQRSCQLFRSYVLKFQQAKEHASGWPAHVTTPVRARLRGPRRSALGPRPHALQPGRACHCQTRVELVVEQIRGIAQQNDDLVHYRSADMAPLCDLPTPRRSCHLSREPRHDHGHVQPARRVYIQLDQRHVHLRVYCGLDDVVGSQEIVRGSVGCVEGTRLLHGHGLVPFRDAPGGRSPCRDGWHLLWRFDG